MTAAAIDPGRESHGLLEWERLLDTWRNLDVPEGWRAELIDGQIVMSPAPATAHNLIASLVHRQLVLGGPDSWAIFQTSGAAIPATREVYIPDICVLVKEGIDPAGTEVGADVLLLAVEIVSERSKATDRKRKKWGYAHGPVPLYLLIDRYDEDGPSVSLFSQPSDGHYQHQVRVPFGEPIVLPEPFGLALDTTEFPR
jgi:Uma2 family endonuclease